VGDPAHGAGARARNARDNGAASDRMETMTIAVPNATARE
jgi:hypothetical protein